MEAVNPQAYTNLDLTYQEIEGGKTAVQQNKPFNEKLSFWRDFFRKYGFDLLNPRLDSKHDLFYFDY